MAYSNIKVFLTGGTVTADVTGIGQGLSAKYSSGTTMPLLSWLQTQNCNIESILNKLSEDLTLTDLTLVGKAIEATNTMYDTIIVYTGTDRLTFLAKFLKLTLHLSHMRVFCIGTQRSPEMPSFEGIVVSQLVFDSLTSANIIPGVYVVNYITPYSIEYLEPFTSLKQDVYAKTCYKGTTNYVITRCDKTVHVVKHKKPVTHVPHSTYSIQTSGLQIVELLPGLTLATTLYTNTNKVLLRTTGLCNLSSDVVTEIDLYPHVHFYLANDLYGLKQFVYAADKYNKKNITLLQGPIELNYLKIVLGYVS